MRLAILTITITALSLGCAALEARRCDPNTEGYQACVANKMMAVQGALEIIREANEAVVEIEASHQDAEPEPEVATE